MADWFLWPCRGCSSPTPTSATAVSMRFSCYAMDFFRGRSRSGVTLESCTFSSPVPAVAMHRHAVECDFCFRGETVTLERRRQRLILHHPNADRLELLLGHADECPQVPPARVSRDDGQQIHTPTSDLSQSRNAQPMSEPLVLGAQQLPKLVGRNRRKETHLLLRPVPLEAPDGSGDLAM